jgi:hypothetical protein
VVEVFPPPRCNRGVRRWKRSSLLLASKSGGTEVEEGPGVEIEGYGGGGALLLALKPRGLVPSWRRNRGKSGWRKGPISGAGYDSHSLPCLLLMYPSSYVFCVV